MGGEQATVPGHLELVSTQTEPKLYVVGPPPSHPADPVAFRTGMMPSIPFHRLLSAGSRHDYVMQIILPEIHRLSESGEISGEELLRLEQLVTSQGDEVLLPQVQIMDEVTLTTSDPEGLLGFTSLPVTKTVGLSHFVKRHPTKAAYEESRTIDAMLAVCAEEIGIAEMIPPLLFHSDRDRVTVFPRVHARTLQEVLLEPDPTLRIISVYDAVDAYVTLHQALNSGDAQTRLQFPSRLADFTEYFGKVYSSDAALVASFDKNIGSKLNAAPRSNIHGDSHSQNVLVDGTHSFIDWSHACSDGFAEFDLHKLLKKTDLPMDQEYEVAAHAATQLFPDSVVDQYASFERYVLNKITQELISARKYCVAASTEQYNYDRTRNIGMGNVLYTDALSRIEDAIDRGFVDKEFYDLVSSQAPQEGDITLRRLSTVEYSSVKMQANPRVNQTLENIAQKTLLERAEEIVPEEVIERIGKGVVRRRRLSLAGKAVSGLAGLTALVALPFVALELSEQRVQRLAEEHEQALEAQIEFADIARQQYRLQDSFTSEFQRPYFRLLRAKSRGEEAQGLSLKSPALQEVANRYSLDPELLRNMIRANKVVAGLHSGGSDINPEDNYLDPFSAEFECHKVVSKGSWMETTDRINHCFVDPIENLEIGAARLATLIEQSDGDMKLALWEFYAAIPEDNLTSLYKDPRTHEPTINRIANIIYSVLEHRGYQTCDAPRFVNLYTAPEGYLRNYTFDVEQ